MTVDEARLEATATPPRIPAWRWCLRAALIIAVGVVLVFALRGRVPDPAAVLDVAADADPRWAILAVLAQMLSQAMFAHQQRRLLAAFTVDVSMPRALAITYSRSAISMALPAGSAVSAAFAVQQYRRRGATAATAATIMVLSGVASIVGLVLLYAAGLLATASAEHAILAGSATIAVTGGALAWSITRAGSAAPRPAAPRPETRWPAANKVLEHIRATAHRARTVPARHWAATIAFAASNWLLDLACLAAVARACHLSLGYTELAGVYLAVQIVRQFPVTPGGIGLIETSLLTGLVAAGAPQTNAAAVVLGYRLISFWLILPIGLATYLALRRPPNPQR